MSSFLRSLFGTKKSNPNIKPRMQSRRLELLGLEERITPAVVASFTGNALTLLSDNNDTFTVSSDINGVISITGTTVTAGDANVTVVAGSTSTVTVNSGAGGAAAVQVLALTGDNTTEIQDITLTNINSTAFNTNFGVSFNLFGADDIVRLGGSINLKGTGTFIIDDPASGVDTIVLGQGSDLTLTSESGVITLDSASGGFGTSLVNSATINSTSGNVTLGDEVVFGGGKNLTINSGTGTVTATGTLGSLSPLGNLTITSTNATSSAISLAAVTAGDISLTGTGDISVSGIVAATSVNAKSSTGDVIFGNTVTTTAVGGFTSEATLATKATKIANLVDVQNGANALVIGNLLATADTTPQLKTAVTGTINITGKIDGAAATNDLRLTAANGAITIGGAVGGTAATPTLDVFTINGGNSLLASGTINIARIVVGNTTPFTSSVTFAEAIAVVNNLVVKTSGTGTISFAKTITGTGGTTTIDLTSVNGSITVTGNITGKSHVTIESTGSGAISVAGITNEQNSANIEIISDTGNITTTGEISAKGSSSEIDIYNYSGGDITINGDVSTGADANILLIIGTLHIGNGNLNINAAVYTMGTYTDPSKGISISSGCAGTVNVNKAISTNGSIYFNVFAQTNTLNVAQNVTITADTVLFDAQNTNNTINLASGANITAVARVEDNGAGNLNLASNIIVTGANSYILIDNMAINLTGAVSMKAAGTGSDITLGQNGTNTGSLNGAQNLTLEATDFIQMNAVGQTTPLNTLTVTNSNRLTASDFSAANVVLSDITDAITFFNNTSISKSLTTAAKGYYLAFNGTTVIAGAPVFLNTGNVGFYGVTSLPSGASIVGNATSQVEMDGTIVSGGAFNIGTSGNTGLVLIYDGTQLILNSNTANSTIANPIDMYNGGSAGVLNLLGVGTLRLSADSSASTQPGDSINVTNGTLNVTGKVASAISLTNGTLTGSGGTVGNLTPAVGTVAPGGTLNTGVVTFNAATNYSADVLTTTTASNLTGNAGFNLGGATLTLESVASGLAVGNSFTIINNTAVSGGLSGQFYNLPEGSSVSAKDASGNTVAFTISYVGGTGANDVTLTVYDVIPRIILPEQPMVVGQPVLNKFTLTGADAGGGPLVTVTFSDGTYTTFFAYASTFTGGVRVAAADVNGDGILDIVTGAGPGGGPQVNVFSFTSTGEVVLRQSFFAFNDPSFTGGVYVAAGDTNNDHFDDVVIGAGAGGGPRVQVFGGSADGVVTSAPLNDFFAYSTSFTGGVVVAACDRTGDSFGNQEVITGPASNGGFNVKSFEVNGQGNNPTLIDNFFAFNDTTSIGGLSLAASPFGGGLAQDLLIGSTNSQFGVVIDQTGDSAPVTITANPFLGFTGAIRVGIAIDSNDTRYAIAAAGPGGGPVISLFSVGANSLTQIDSLFVMNPAFTGGLFASS